MWLRASEGYHVLVTARMRVSAVRHGAPLVLLGYAGVAVTFGWWPSAIGATIVAWLLWRQHARARFAAYVFLSIMTVRAVVTGLWPLALFAAAFIGLLQLPAARSIWPRLTWGRPLR
jgi:hypothetical protein